MKESNNFSNRTDGDDREEPKYLIPLSYKSENSLSDFNSLKYATKYGYKLSSIPLDLSITKSGLCSNACNNINRNFAYNSCGLEYSDLSTDGPSPLISLSNSSVVVETGYSYIPVCLPTKSCSIKSILEPFLVPSFS
ncbi:predicted protein [Candida tropicalis MYA-3404]|uniref:Uncharacterized protein n=1 Tax=Candida tropicalis (strain ATCC MYA-3404 / T1) TaxID=294747 RepID=C5M9D5_CANTT|nr:predicted protein [Candida tropicalis MYA-3404]EER34189.1 predicted protein [Candida tropicalis MYA-3404]KAG4408053.1 hypothetical protein JTP64_003589 [Candida tropicalis]